MYTLSSEILALTSEPAALLQNRRLVFANAGAKEILGEDCVGKGIRELFGDEVAEAQAASFAASVPIRGHSRLLRVSREGNLQVVFFSQTDLDCSLFNDAYLQALRSGLMNIRLAAAAGEQLADGSENPALMQSFSRLSREYYRMNRLLSNISAARAILENDLPVALGVVDLSAILSDLVDSLSLLRPDVAFSFSSDRRSLLWADQHLLELLLMNLLSNCLTHAVGLTRVRIDLFHDVSRVFLSVQDDGCGIPAEKMSGLFHRYRSAYQLSEMSAGSGLGMTVIRGITEAHGGALMVESREGSGTLVRLSLSRRLGSESALKENAVPYAGSSDLLLTGLSSCLPEECFSRRFVD